jgi:putative hydrolase of the HAD superfamily
MIRALICDLGNVLLFFDPGRIEKNLRAKIADTAEVPPYGLSSVSALIDQFERGSVEPHEFYERFLQALDAGGAVDYETFSECWSDIFTLNEEMVRFLPSLARSFRLVMLSNTNELHIRFARARFPEVFEPFSAFVFSHECGSVKPDTAVFQRAVAEAGASVDEILYIDDIQEYVEKAGALGISAYRYVTTEGFLAFLEHHTLGTRLLL